MSLPTLDRRCRLGAPNDVRRLAALGLASATIGLFAALVPSVGGAATPPNTAKFTFSGAEKGTLKGNVCNGGPAAVGGQFEFDGQKLSGVKGVDTWTLDVDILSGKGGTYKNLKINTMGLTETSVVLQGQTNASEYNWHSTKGTITAHKGTGTLNVMVGPYAAPSGVSGKGVVHIKGSWNCPASS